MIRREHIGQAAEGQGAKSCAKKSRLDKTGAHAATQERQPVSITRRSSEPAAPNGWPMTGCEKLVMAGLRGFGARKRCSVFSRSDVDVHRPDCVTSTSSSQIAIRCRSRRRRRQRHFLGLQAPNCSEKRADKRRSCRSCGVSRRADMMLICASKAGMSIEAALLASRDRTPRWRCRKSSR